MNDYQKITQVLQDWAADVHYPGEKKCFSIEPHIADYSACDINISVEIPKVLAHDKPIASASLLSLGALMHKTHQEFENLIVYSFLEKFESKFYKKVETMLSHKQDLMLAVNATN